MSADAIDQVKRNEGGRARLAYSVVELAVWERSAELIRRAEALQDSDDLTPDRAHTILIAILEQRQLSASLAAYIKEGDRAAMRINRRADAAAEKARAEKHAETHGLNRFTRSKVAG